MNKKTSHNQFKQPSELEPIYISITNEETCNRPAFIFGFIQFANDPNFGNFGATKIESYSSKPYSEILYALASEKFKCSKIRIVCDSVYELPKSFVYHISNISGVKATMTYQLTEKTRKNATINNNKTCLDYLFKSPIHINNSSYFEFLVGSKKSIELLFFIEEVEN